MKTTLRKPLAILSLVACTAFSVALAQAETGDSASDTSASSDMSSDSSMSGTTGVAPAEEAGEAAKTPQAMGEEYWQTAKSCSMDGKTYKRGEKGFSKCVDKMKEKAHEEMGGQKPGDMDMGEAGSMDSGSYSEEASSS